MLLDHIFLTLSISSGLCSCRTHPWLLAYSALIMKIERHQAFTFRGVLPRVIIVKTLVHPLNDIRRAILVARCLATIVTREKFLLGHVVTLHILLLLLCSVCGLRLDHLILLLQIARVVYKKLTLSTTGSDDNLSASFLFDDGPQRWTHRLLFILTVIIGLPLN